MNDAHALAIKFYLLKYTLAKFNCFMHAVRAGPKGRQSA